jgi:UDP-N-acetyl-D-mannosaminuronate dehydrogenase
MKSMNICIVGIGYVGLPLAVQFARSGATVVGLDIDQAKVDQINAGRTTQTIYASRLGQCAALAIHEGIHSRFSAGPGYSDV